MAKKKTDDEVDEVNGDDVDDVAPLPNSTKVEAASNDRAPTSPISSGKVDAPKRVAKAEFAEVGHNEYGRTMTFPAEVTLPMRIVAETGVDRIYRILSPTQPVPQVIIEYLKNDIRYLRWFD